MKFNFKIQQYQTEAVQAVVNVFKGQAKLDPFSNRYRRDLGYKSKSAQLSFEEIEENFDIGFKNNALALNQQKLLQNITEIQSKNNIKHEKAEANKTLKLNVEMETGTGKTYVYIKTIFELYKQYGWSKFIIVVPSVAIREGVKKSFEMTQEHFMQEYQKKARFFVYSSANLHQLDDFSSSADINVMIINMQAFSSSLKEDGKSKESKIIYSKRDDFQSRRPIDVIKANNPVVILDEPQKMGGEATKKSILGFNPLFILNYSATHKEKNHLVYVLDALEAYNQRLVKKIEVKGFELKNLKGTDSYLYLEQIIISPKHAPRAKIELEVAQKSSISRKSFICEQGDDLYLKSNKLEQYKNLVIGEIDYFTNTVHFLNGKSIVKGDVASDNEHQNMRRIQIRETIKSHFEKEKILFENGIKTLSLFFIDEVANYRQYDEDNTELLGDYGKFFEEEYITVFNEYKTLLDEPYQHYLQKYCNDVNKVHKGYFSIDKGKAVNSKIKRGSDISDDESAYDLILKNKERLLSFEEPTRFIFSHSALREGWDNPNIFQICTLKHSDSNIGKRQEVGRGLRLCVDQEGNRMDSETLGGNVHNINKLTVIASESYTDFVTAFQNETKEELYDRPTKASQEYFEGKTITIDNALHNITKDEAKAIHRYLIKNNYVDDNDSVTDIFREDLANQSIAELPEAISYMQKNVIKLVQAVFDPSILDSMIDDGNKPKMLVNELNKNFRKDEFQALWKQINHKYSYAVKFDSDELIKNAIRAIDNELIVAKFRYTMKTGAQKENINEYEIGRNASFKESDTEKIEISQAETNTVKYDLIGKLAVVTKLSRKTIVSILQGITGIKFAMYAENPEEFISKVSRLIIEQKATMIVEHIYYNKIDDVYDSSIFTTEKKPQDVNRLLQTSKHIQDYVEVDSKNERSFAESLENAKEVCVYAKLPRGFQIPTPVGNYSPDWAISFYKGTVKHIFFVAETKGSMSSLELRPVELAKISCAKKLFNELSTDEVRYHEVTSYEDLLNVVEGI